MSRFNSEPEKETPWGEIVLSVVGLAAGVLGWFLFKEEVVWVRNYFILLGGLAVAMTCSDLIRGTIRRNPLATLRSLLVNFSALFKSFLLVFLILPIVVLQFFLGPAAVFGAILSSIMLCISFIEEILGFDIVAVDVAKEGPSFFFSLALFLGCASLLGISYLFVKYEIVDKGLDLMADALRDLGFHRIAKDD